MNIEINDLLVNDVVNRVCNMLETQTMQKNLKESDAKKVETQTQAQEKAINTIGAIISTVVEYFKENKEGQIKALKDELKIARETIENTYSLITDPSFSSSNPDWNNRLSNLRKLKNLTEEKQEVESENENEVEPTSKKKK